MQKKLKGSVKEPNIMIYFFFPPITQSSSVSNVLFTGGRGVSDFNVLKHYQLSSVNILNECLHILIDCRLQNLLQRVVRFFHPRSSCTMTHISADVQRITLNASCMTISGERTEQLDIFCHITGFMSDFLRFIDVKLIQFTEPFNYGG